MCEEENLDKEDGTKRRVENEKKKFSEEEMEVIQRRVEKIWKNTTKKLKQKSCTLLEFKEKLVENSDLSLEKDDIWILVLLFKKADTLVEESNERNTAKYENETLQQNCTSKATGKDAYEQENNQPHDLIYK